MSPGASVACAGRSDLFFSEDSGQLRRAKRLCAACPVREQCLAAAIERNECFGVWGGMTLSERRRVVREAA